MNPYLIDHENGISYIDRYFDFLDRCTRTGRCDPGMSRRRPRLGVRRSTRWRESARSADTHLRIDLAGFPTSVSTSGRARIDRQPQAPPRPFAVPYALCNGRLQAGQDVVDASSGSTAIAEAWFARLLDLRFTLMPAARRRRWKRSAASIWSTMPPTCTRAPACARGACHLDQFGLAERATDWRGNNNIAESIIGQLAREPQPQPAWIVCGAGTGGTSATIGRYLRYRRLPTRLCVAEPAGSAFVHGWRTRDARAVASQPTVIEGIGRPRVEPGFLFDVVDAVLEIPDEASIAAAWTLEALLGRRYGGSSGTNFVACLQLRRRTACARRSGNLVTLLCDRGERYAETLFDAGWLQAHALQPERWRAPIEASLREGRAPLPRSP